MGQVIQVCGRCGFNIPDDVGYCPGCGPAREAPSLAARQVAGLALPTRSVHRLPNTPPRRERPPRAVGPAQGARSAFSYTSLLVLIALLGAGLSWVVRLERYVLAVPNDTAERLDRLTVAATWASVAGLAIGLLALAPWGLRHIGAGIARRRDEDDTLT